MDPREESSRFGSLRGPPLRNLSSSSSTFFSANQSPFFSPRSPTCQIPTRYDIPSGNSNANPCVDPIYSSSEVPNREFVRFPSSDISPFPSASTSSDFLKVDQFSSPTGINNFGNDYIRRGERQKKLGWFYESSYSPTSTSFSSTRLRNHDVYIGFHGRKPLLLRFANWFRAELEVQGISCFLTDRARCRNSRKHEIVERAMDACTFGVVILTRKSFRNPYTIEELLFFSGKKNLVPIYFDLSPDDCLVRDIVERRGEMWEKHGGELWLLYGGDEKEWKDAFSALSRVDEWKLEGHDGNWRDCILRAVTLLALRLGRRSVVDRLTKWKEKAGKEEFPFPRNENFIGRKKELSELEFMLFGDVSGDAERDYFELKARHRRKNVTIGWGRSSSVEEKRREGRKESGRRKGKEPVIWKESEKEIEMQNTKFCVEKQALKAKKNGRHGRRRRSTNVVYGKGVACVSGDSGIGKTELLLEFAYRFHQRYKMVLWVGGESRCIRQNYLNLWPFLDVDVGVESGLEKGRIKSFEEQEESAVARVRKELMRNIPFLVVIDNLESEKDWWDRKLIMDLLPRFGGETHILISTSLPRVMNLEPLKLSCLSGVEALSLMQGSNKDYPIAEIDSLRVIEEKLGRKTLGIAIVGAILSELPINPSRLLDTINRMPSRHLIESGRESHSLRKNNFLLQLFEVCFSIFDHADRPRSLATRMVEASGWFAPAAIPTPLLALTAHKIPEKHRRSRLWKRFLRSLTCGFTSSYIKKSEAEASSMLLRFNIARSCSKEDHIQFNEIVKIYVRKRGVTGVARAVVQAVITRGISLISHHSEHIWAACFLLFDFGNNPAVVELKVSELIFLVKEVILPLTIRTFITFSRCSAALELLRLCTNALETAEQAFVAPVEKWLDKSLCWKPIQTNAQLNPCLWQELALTRAVVLDTRAKLMLRGGQFDIGDDLIRKVIFIRTSICGEDHPDTISARETLSKITRLLANVQIHTSNRF
ncbi:Disease resistance protein [Actinidia chinensis var. chinensis]|uniref:Disease resistance protein n=1 Tax=Actinidia chinensis var. chinensis TaxID=1590841 RepID=A0A2R6PHX5_ACTCC|nr:Disease resistance protein [Actinidia chinensis var. chinensis]